MLLAAVAAQEIRQRHQVAVAVVVTVAVVDELEVIRVDQEDRAEAERLGILEQPGQAALEPAPVQQSRQQIQIALGLDLPALFDLLGHVDNDAQHIALMHRLVDADIPLLVARKLVNVRLTRERVLPELHDIGLERAVIGEDRRHVLRVKAEQLRDIIGEADGAHVTVVDIDADTRAGTVDDVGEHVGRAEQRVDHLVDVGAQLGEFLRVLDLDVLVEVALADLGQAFVDPPDIAHHIAVHVPRHRDRQTDDDNEQRRTGNEHVADQVAVDDRARHHIDDNMISRHGKHAVGIPAVDGPVLGGGALRNVGHRQADLCGALADHLRRRRADDLPRAGIYGVQVGIRIRFQEGKNIGEGIFSVDLVLCVVHRGKRLTRLHKQHLGVLAHRFMDRRAAEAQTEHQKHDDQKRGYDNQIVDDLQNQSRFLFLHAYTPRSAVIRVCGHALPCA